MPIRSISLPASIARFAWASITLVLTVSLLGACGSDNNSSPPDAPELIDTLPASWTPIMFDSGRWLRQGNPWLPINIDGDAEPEYLLFFTYDSGQAGAVIYDQQTGSVTVTSPTPASAPNQPTGTYIPYRIEPNYWTGSGAVGYVAPPGVSAADLNYAQVERLDPNDPGGQPTGNNNELDVIGSNKVLTVIWWQGEYNGYGVAQVGATFGLVNPVHEQNNSARPIVTITGLNPVAGIIARSLICRETLYERGSAPEAPGVVEPAQPAVQYTGIDRGLGFCTMPPPTYPFYPEGVVLAFLKPENRSDPEQTPEQMAAYRDQFLASDATADEIQNLLTNLDINGTGTPMFVPVIVQDLVAPATIPAAPEERVATDGSIVTRVCAQVAPPTLTKHWRLLFELVHQPPSFQTEDGTPVATTDLWHITHVTDVTNLGTTCSAVIVQMTSGPQ